MPPPFLSRITYYQGRSHDFLNSIKLKSLPIQEVTWRHCRNPSRDRGISAVSNLNSIVVVNISQFKCIGGVTCGLQSQFRCFNIKINSTPQGDYTVYCIQWPFHSWQLGSPYVRSQIWQATKQNRGQKVILVQSYRITKWLQASQIHQMSNRHDLLLHSKVRVSFIVIRDWFWVGFFGGVALDEV